MREANAPAYEAVALHDAARLGAATKAAQRLTELAQHRGTVIVHCNAEHTTALASHDSTTLERVSQEFETIGARLLAAETAAEASHAYWQAGRADSARRQAARAAQLAAQCDNPATPALQGHEMPELTPRQWEIARLAASGLTNQQIAEQLVVSVRTVHNHLNQAYAKLGVHARAQLASLLLYSPNRPGAEPSE
ncbi:MAG TPA: helix-turn-helix transcriptional regulator [Candidatus Limnocylindrales bacterium]|nr:helix-turn-helix transcriptional regulator [Candidatus Limnocylindrales bacterium]